MPSAIAGPIINSANGHSYYLLEASTWMAAEQAAAKLGGHLVTINDQAEQSFVFSQFRQYGGVRRHLWIGLRDADSKNNSTVVATRKSEFRWVSGEPVSFSNWADGEPNNWNQNGEFFVQLYYADGRWNDNINGEQPDLPLHGVVELVPTTPPAQLPVITVQPRSQTVTLGASVTLLVEASGAPPLAYQWRKDGSNIPGANAATLTLSNTRSADAGTYTVVVSSRAGSVTSSTAIVTVNPPPNQSPTMALTAPASGAAFTVPASITLQASASDPDGAVVKVEFFEGSTKLGEDATAPFSLAWNNVAAGTYTLTARATDSNGATTTSAAVSIQVNPAPTQPNPPVITLHPTDNNPADNRITIAEMTAYASAWKSGKSWPIDPNPIPVAYLTRAASLWKSGEVYRYDAALGAPPLCWAAAANRAPQGLKSGMALQSVSSGTATSELPATYTAGTALTVKLTVTPPASVIAYAIEEAPPAGWTVASVTDGGVFDPPSGKIKWGPFFDNQVRSPSYSVTPPANATGLAKFQGIVSFDGVDTTIAGQRETSTGGSTQPVPATGPAISEMAATYTPGIPLPVSLQIKPVAATIAYAVEDRPPAGWTVSAVTEGGVFDTASGVIKWGTYFDNQSRTLKYSATPPANATGPATFRGAASFDGIDVAITGVRQVTTEGSTILPVSAPRMLSDCLTPDSTSVLICFEAIPGRLYELEKSENLKDWSRTSLNVRANSATATIRYPREAAPQQFFRVRLADQPSDAQVKARLIRSRRSGARASRPRSVWPVQGRNFPEPNFVPRSPEPCRSAGLRPGHREDLP